MSSFDLENELATARRRFNAVPDGSSIRECESVVTEYFSVLIDRQYTREQLYLIANGLTESNNHGLSPNMIDAIRNYETGLTGQCSRKAVIRLSPSLDEPADEDALVDYVRNLRWTNDPSIRPVN